MREEINEPSELEKMLAGELYCASDAELSQMRLRAREQTRAFNEAHNWQAREPIARDLFGCIGENCEIEGGFRCDYGAHIFLGDRVFINFNCVILDCARIDIEDDVLIAPNVSFYAATHPLDPVVRVSLQEMARPIRVQRAAWIGGSAILLPGVTVGMESVVGASSVVTRDVPARTVVAGNPARVIREL
jgi:acetyltransferase-like isoleucine patch superfamily enzyme